MLILADNGRILDANPAAARLAEVSENELARRSIFDFADQDPSMMDRKGRHHLEVGYEQGEEVIRLPDGNLRTVAYTVTRVAPDRHMLVLRDVTARRAVEREVIESEHKFRALFDNAADAIYITDDDGRIVDANAAAVELGGIAYDDLLGAPVTSLVGPGDDKKIVSLHQELLASGAQRGTFDAVWPDGRRETLEYTAVADFIPGRHLTMVRTVGSDAAADRTVISGAA